MYIKKFVNPLIISIVLILTFVIMNPSNLQASTSDYGYVIRPLQIIFFNVGQGDSIFVKLPNGKSLLIDGGDVEHGSVVIKKLKKLRVKTIDLMVSTHPDIDHIGGLLKVIGRIKVKKIVESGKSYSSHTYYLFKKEAYQNNIPIETAKSGSVINLDHNIKINILNSNIKSESNNDSSVVLKITYKEISILLTGDIEKKTEKRLSKSENLKAQVVKIPHHGSSTSTSEAFITAVNPRVAIISYDRFNLFGHPHRSVVKRLKRLGVKVYTTAENDDVELVTNGKKIYIENHEVLVN